MSVKARATAVKSGVGVFVGSGVTEGVVVKTALGVILGVRLGTTVGVGWGTAKLQAASRNTDRIIDSRFFMPRSSRKPLRLL